MRNKKVEKVESKGPESTIFYVIKTMLLNFSINLKLVCFLRKMNRFMTKYKDDKDADFNNKILKKKLPFFFATWINE